MDILSKGLEIAELLNDNPGLAEEVGIYIETEAASKLIAKTSLHCDFEDLVSSVAKGLAKASGDKGGYEKYIDQAFYLLDI